MHAAAPGLKALFKTALATALASIALAAGAQGAGDFPNKPVHFIFPSTAGGVGANLMHVLAQKLSEKWKQPVLVEPRPGANSAIGTDMVAKAAPDGYTILLASSQHVILHHSMRNLPYDAIRDFTPIAVVAKLQYIMAANPALPANTLQEFIALAKAKPDSLTFGSGGAGGPAHLAAEQFMVMTGTKLRHIPYNNKGAAAVLADLMGSQIDIYFTPPGIGGFVSTGKLKAYAVSGENRSRALPQVPTFREAGLPQLDISGWYGVLGPANMPKAIADKLTADFNEVVNMPDVREKMMTMEVEPYTLTAAQYGALMKADKDRYTKVIQDAGLNLAQ